LLWIALRHLPDTSDKWTWIPFGAATALFTLAFAGLAYSFYPFVVPEQMTIYEAASAPESLIIILVGALAVLPMIIGYTALSYIVFRGKATELRYY
ncbi:MAG: cytochrome d ubiquinol oxidase subunit II, partial [Pseudomonadota bacterium]